ncbi:MAG: N-glycosylase/DNA lyase [Desulfurococcales archaeon]|nr:N-glycosylase/DNA lyase [Desulfurococcales archaeon]
MDREAVVSAIREIGAHGVLCLEEDDPQYWAVLRVSRAHGPGLAAVLAVLNALASYRLAMRGEDWWSCWAEHMERARPAGLPGAVAAEIEFLDRCRGAAIQREAKKRRVLRAGREARTALQRLLENPLSVLDSAAWLVEALSRALRASPRSKTIVFAAKMAYYAARAAGARRLGPWDVDIPVDVRVACFLYSTGLARARSYRDLVSRPEQAQQAVRRLAAATGIPPINLDTIFWRTGWIPRDLEPVRWEEAALQVLGRCASPSAARALARSFRARCR